MSLGTGVLMRFGFALDERTGAESGKKSLTSSSSSKDIGFISSIGMGLK